MEVDKKDSLMGMFIEEIIKIIGLMDLEHMLGVKELFIKVVSKTDYGMERENGLLDKLNIQEAMQRV